MVIIKDSNQRSITEMFQRSFTEDDDVDEAILLEAANDWEEAETPEKYHSANRQSPSKRSIRDFFSPSHVKNIKN